MRLSVVVSVLAFLAISLSTSNSIYGQAEMLWQHELPCNGPCGTPILAVTDSGYIYVAHIWDGDAAVYKYDQKGEFLWDRLYGTGGNSVSWPRQIAVDKSGAVYLSG